MKNSAPLAFLCFFCFATLGLFAQRGNDGMFVRAVSTGQATGVIGHIYISGSGQSSTVSFPSSIIKPIPLETGQLSQGYVIDPVPSTLVSPNGDTLRVPITGYCLDVRKPPVPFGTELPSPDQWINEVPGDPSPYVPFPAEETWPPSLLPGTLENALGRPFSVSYDSYKNPDLVSDLIFPVYNRVLLAYETLDAEGAIVTPYKDYRQTQRKTVIQYTLWRYTSALEGTPFTEAEFEKRMDQQFVQRFGTRPGDASETQGMQYKEGMDQLWAAFELTGKKAKVITLSAPAPPEIVQPPEEVAPIITCGCESCELIKPWSFAWLGFLRDGSVKTTANNATIPYGTYVRVTPPQVRVDCGENCKGELTEALEITYIRQDGREDRDSYQTDSAFTFYFNTPGKVEFQYSYQCKCPDGACQPDTLMKSYEAVKTNPCCDKLRDPNTQLLTFQAGKGQYVEIIMDQLSFSLKDPDVMQSITFPFNLEAAFCNLDDNRVISLFESSSSAHKELDGSFTENLEIRDVLLSHNDGAGGQDPYYHLSIQLQKDGKDIQVVLSLDKSRCKYDISIYYDGRFVEFTQPIYNPSELIDLVLELPDQGLSEAGYWNRMFFLGMQFLKGIESDPEGYETKYNYWKGKLENALSKCINTTDDQSIKAAAEALRTFSYSDPEAAELMTGLMRFINQFHNLPSG